MAQQEGRRTSRNLPLWRGVFFDGFTFLDNLPNVYFFWHSFVPPFFSRPKDDLEDMSDRLSRSSLAIIDHGQNVSDMYYYHHGIVHCRGSMLNGKLFLEVSRNIVKYCDCEVVH